MDDISNIPRDGIFARHIACPLYWKQDRRYVFVRLEFEHFHPKESKNQRCLTSCIQLNDLIINELGHLRSFIPENFLTLSILFLMSVLPRPVTSRLSHISRTPCSLLLPRPSFWLVSFEIFLDFLVWSSSGMAATGRFALATLDSLCLKALETSHHSAGTSREYSKLVYESYHLKICSVVKWSALI